jgi:hypothetical protein
MDLEPFEIYEIAPTLASLFGLELSLQIYMELSGRGLKCGGSNF